ncbi:hypothetical protein SRHO_G00172750 [Serrasalmus rhombeus]
MGTSENEEDLTEDQTPLKSEMDPKSRFTALPYEAMLGEQIKMRRKPEKGKRGEGVSAVYGKNLLSVLPRSRLHGSRGEIAMATPTWEHLLT